MALSSRGLEGNRRRLYRFVAGKQADFSAMSLSWKILLLSRPRRGRITELVGAASSRLAEASATDGGPRRLSRSCLREVFMKRILAFAALFVVCAGPVTADYLFIKIDLKKITFGANGGNTGQPGIQQGMPGLPEVQPGGQPGFQPKGFPGGMQGM